MLHCGVLCCLCLQWSYLLQGMLLPCFGVHKGLQGRVQCTGATSFARLGCSCLPTVRDQPRVGGHCSADTRGLSEEQVAVQRQQLLTELYRRTGPAKCKEAASHIRDLLEQGTACGT